MANLRDVARRADVDPSTVSRVLRDDPSQQVRPETRARILAAARELSYRPNALARGLRTRRTDTIGLIIPSLDNLGFSDVTHGIQAAAAAAGKLVMVVDAGAVDGSAPEWAEALDGGGESTHPSGPEASATAEGDVYERLIGDGRLDGLIVAFAALDDRHVAQLAEREIPLVLVNRRTSGVHGSVVVDDVRGAATAVEHLVRLGHRRIGSIGLAADTDTARRRDRGYREAMAVAGLPIDPRWVEAGPPTVEGGRAALYRLLAASRASRPTGIVVASLMSAVGVLSALRDSGQRVPDDVSLVAFNDHPFADHTAPPLTTVRMPNLRMGQEAVRMLLDALDGVPVGDLVMPEAPELVVRGIHRLAAGLTGSALEVLQTGLTSARVSAAALGRRTRGGIVDASLEGRVAIVTGAGQGMGQAFARALAAAGAHVAVAEIDAGTGEAAAAEIRANGHRATAYRVDVRERAQIQAMADDLVARHGRIDILVNNAGLAAGGPSEDVTDEDWDRVYGVMLKGLFLCSQVAGRVMIGQGRGVILNICSMAGLGGWAKRALYTPAKAGAISMTQVLGVEWAKHGVRVVGVSPGQVETPLNEVVFKAGLADRETFTNRAPMRRFASPEEIADAVLFLVSDAASGITAEVVTIDGGWIAWGGIEEPVGV